MWITLAQAGLELVCIDGQVYCRAVTTEAAPC